MQGLPQNHRIDDLNRMLEGIYDDYRTILLNTKYNGVRLQTSTYWNRLLEIIVGVAILVSLIKPIWNLGRSIEEYSKLWAEYATLSARFRNAIRAIEGARNQIAESGELPQKVVEEIEAIRTKMVELAPRGDQHPSPRRVRALQAQVNIEVPAATLWVLPPAEEN